MPAKPIRRLPIIFAGLLATGVPALAAGLLTIDLGGIPPILRGISRDGSTIVGTLNLNPVLWSADTGQLRPLSLGGYFVGEAYAVNADGTVFVGSGFDPVVQYGVALRWLGTLAPQPLGNFDGDAAAPLQPSEATGVSDDGTVIVGTSTHPGGRNRAFRWEAASGRMTDLGTLNGGSESRANAVSGDGKVVVGGSADGRANNQMRAFRFVLDPNGNGSSGAMTGLGTLPGGTWSEAVATNSDGSVVAGSSDSRAGQRAFRWTVTEGMRDLGTLSGDTVSWAQAISGDGRVVVGTSQLVQSRAFRWTAVDGMRSINDLLTEAGVNLGGMRLVEALGTNQDGSIIIGRTANDRGYIARLPVPRPPAPAVPPPASPPVAPTPGSTPAPPPSQTPGTTPNTSRPAAPQPPAGVTDLETFTETLSAAATVADFAFRMAEITLNGAHGKPTRGVLEPGQTALWTAGDLARIFADGLGGSKGLVELGAARGLEGGVNLRLSVGTFEAESDLEPGGSQRGRMLYAVPEVTAKISDELQLTLTALYGQGTTRTKRGYLNGSDLDYSSGDGSTKIISGRVRADWLDALRVGGTSISPFASYTLSRSEFGGYTETGGAFPVRWDDYGQTTHVVRAGIDMATPVAEKITLLGHVEANYQADNNHKGATGHVIGLNDFEGSSPKGGFGAQAGLGAEYDAGFGTATVMLNLSTGPNGRSGWVAASLRGIF